MVERFASFSNDPASFFSGTPYEHKKLNYGCNLNMNGADAHRVMEFFKYIKYSLGIYGIKTMFGVEHVEPWKVYDSIHFYFLLTETMQSAVIEKYNAMYDCM